MISRSKSKSRATPSQLRRTGYLVAAFAVFVLVFSVYREIDYAGFAETAQRVDARIVRIDAVREGKGTRHTLHYELDHRGTTHRYSDTTDGQTKLEELYTGSFNAFTGDDPPLKVGKTIGLLVNPYSADDHRPDRDKLTFPSALWLTPLFGIVFLSSVATFLLWAGQEPKGGAPPGTPSRSSHVSSSSEDGVLRVRARLDVPWPPTHSSQNDDVQAKLRERSRHQRHPCYDRGDPLRAQSRRGCAAARGARRLPRRFGRARERDRAARGRAARRHDCSARRDTEDPKPRQDTAPGARARGSHVMGSRHHAAVVRRW